MNEHRLERGGGPITYVSACFVVHNTRLYSVVDTVVGSGEDISCSVEFSTIVGVSVLCDLSCR